MRTASYNKSIHRFGRSEFLFFTGWGAHLFFITQCGTLWGCGDGKFGQLSIEESMLGEGAYITSPQKVEFFTPNSRRKVKSIGIGLGHSIFLTEGAGRTGVFSSGRNDYCQCSDSTNIGPCKMAVQCHLDLDGSRVIDVTAGFNSSFFLTSDGHVLSAGNYHYFPSFSCANSPGRNTYHQLCLGHNRMVNIAERISTLSHVVEVVSADEWSLFRCQRNNNNRLFACGYGCGQFGIGSNRSVSSPTEITFFKEHNINITSLRASQLTSYFITSKNQVYCSGYADNGEFATGDGDDSVFPVLSRPLSDFELFCNGHTHRFVVIKKNGRIYGSGRTGVYFGLDYNEGLFARTHLQFNNSNSKDGSSLVEIEVLRDMDVRQIATRYEGTFVICGNGSIFATGVDGDGEVLMMNDGESKKDSTINRFVFVGKYKLMRAGNSNRAQQQERLLFMASRYSMIKSVFIFIGK